MGINSYTISVVQIFILLSFFGINNYGSREIAYAKTRIEKSATFWNVWIIQIGMTIVSFLLFHLLNIFLFNQYNEFLFVQSFLIAFNALEISWFFIGIEELKKVVVRNTILKIFFTITVFVFIDSPDQLFLYMILNICGVIFGNVVLVLSIYKYIEKPSLNIKLLKEHLKKSGVFLIPQLFILIYTTVDKSILGSLADMRNVSFYDQAQRVVRVAIALVSSVSVALLPRMSMYISKNQIKEFDILFTKALRYVLIASIYVVTSIICVAPTFVGWFFGPEFNDIVLLMQLTALIGLFIPVATLIMNALLIPMRQDKVGIKSALYAAIVSLLLNVLLDSIYGALGAVIALVAAELVGVTYRLYYANRYYNFLIEIKIFSKYIIIGTILCTIFIPITNLMSHSILSSFLIEGMVSVFFVVFLLVLKDDLILSILRYVKKFFLERDFIKK